MKHFGLIFTLSLIVTLKTFSQSDVAKLGFNYSALVRDTAGRVQPSKPVDLRFTLLLGQNGTVANAPWIETQSTSTDAFGFVNVSIGTGTKSGGTAPAFSDVDFTVGEFWMLIEVKLQGASAFEPLAKQALQAVPYAKVAGSVLGTSSIPAGTIMAFAGDTTAIPRGWLLCDGRELDNNDPRYTQLFNVIKYNWGTSNNAGKFNIPDTRGYFLRGVSYGSGVDPDALLRAGYNGSNGGDNVGSRQADIFKSHNHGGGNHSHIWTQSVTIDSWGGNVVLGGNGTSVNKGTPPSGIIIATEGGSETRPVNVYVNYIIKL